MAISRVFKRSIIVVVYLALFSLICVGIYYAFIRVAPTCSDGKQNQDETGIDCGGLCVAQCVPPLYPQDIMTREAAFVPAERGTYDVLAKIYNPNDIAGASEFSYVLSIRDVTGAVLAQQSGVSFILPQESKYLLAFHLPSQVRPDHATLEITNPVWQRFQGYTERPKVFVTQQAYSRIQSGPGYGAATGLVINESAYDFRSISVKVVLRDGAGQPLAFNTTEMLTFPAKEQRDFRLVWPTAFPGEVRSFEMLVDADVYHAENFLRQYSPTTPF